MHSSIKMQNGAAVLPPVAQEVWSNWFIISYQKSTSLKLWLPHLLLQQALYFCVYNIAVYFRGNNYNVIICIHNNFTVTRKGKTVAIFLKKKDLGPTEIANYKEILKIKLISRALNHGILS